MNSKIRAVAATIGALLLVGVGCELVESRVSGGPSGVPSRRLEARRSTPLALLGGLRPAVASLAWLRLNLAWERRDTVRTRLLLELVVAADDQPLYYWLHGARMLAYDLPAWANDPMRPAAVREQRARQGGLAALAFLDRAAAHAGSPDLLIEKANLQLRVLHDAPAAARLFREAALQPGAPAYAARIHGELLVAMGRPREALGWLRQVLPGLRADHPADARSVVEARIKALEARVGAN